MRRQELRNSCSSSRPQILNQIVQLIFGEVVGTAVLVFGIEDGPDLLEGCGRAVVQIGGGERDIGELGCIEQAGVVGWLLSSHVERFLACALRTTVAVRAAILERNWLAELVFIAPEENAAAILRRCEVSASKPPAVGARRQAANI